MPAQINDGIFNVVYSELEVVERVFGTWLGEYVLDPLLKKLRKKRSAISNHSKRRYNALDREELLRFFLYRFLLGLEKHQKHDINSKSLEELYVGLFGVNRHDAILGCLDFGNHILTQLIASISRHLQQFIIPGSSCCVDESVFPHYGEKASIEGKLIHIPGKPFDYGMIAYTLTQRLAFSRMSICLAICPNSCGPRVTPTRAAVSLLSALQLPEGPVHFQSHHLHTDSLWSQPATIQLFSHRKIAFTIAIKPNNSLLPTGLLDMAMEDLPNGKARTYTNGYYVVQVADAKESCTAVITSTWRQKNQVDTPFRSSVPFKVAKSIYSSMSSGDIVDAFNLDDHLANEPVERVVHALTGWDMLRPEATQSSESSFTYEAAMELSVKAIRAIHRQKLPQSSQTKKSKIKLIEELFPAEAREHDEHHESARQNKRRLTMAQLTAQKEEVSRV